MDENFQKMDIERDDIVTVTDVDGNNHECVILDIVTYNNKNFASLVPVEILEDSEIGDEEELDTADFFIMKIESDKNGSFLKSIDEDEDYEEVCQIMMERLSDDFDIEY